jgi:hypothetical protein
LKAGSFPWRSSLTAPVFATYLFMGGYLGDATIVTLLYAFLIIGPRSLSRASTSGVLHPDFNGNPAVAPLERPISS